MQEIKGVLQIFLQIYKKTPKICIFILYGTWKSKSHLVSSWRWSAHLQTGGMYYHLTLKGIKCFAFIRQGNLDDLFQMFQITLVRIIMSCSIIWYKTVPPLGPKYILFLTKHHWEGCNNFWEIRISTFWIY